MNHNQTLEHFEICDGTEFEKRGLKDSDVMGRVIFWRMKQKMTQKPTDQKFIYLMLLVGDLITTIHVNCVDCK